MSILKIYTRLLLNYVTRNYFCKDSLLKMSNAGLIPKLIWKRLPVEGTFSVFLPDGTSFKYSATANESIGRSIFWRGLKSYEPETVKVFSDIARNSKLILDIGANTGLFTLIAAASNPTCRIISFEPVPHICDRLKAHIELNGLEQRCQVRQEALTNRIGSAKFHIPLGEVPTSASLNTHGFRGTKGYLIEVPVDTVDNVCSEKRVDLVKIDVEGFEDKVLEGMQRVLLESAPIIIIECNPDGPFQAVESILDSFGYRFFHLRREGPVQVRKIIPDINQRERNFLCAIDVNRV